MSETACERHFGGYSISCEECTRAAQGIAPAQESVILAARMAAVAFYKGKNMEGPMHRVKLALEKLEKLRPSVLR